MHYKKIMHRTEYPCVAWLIPQLTPGTYMDGNVTTSQHIRQVIGPSIPLMVFSPKCFYACLYGMHCLTDYGWPHAMQLYTTHHWHQLPVIGIHDLLSVQQFKQTCLCHKGKSNMENYRQWQIYIQETDFKIGYFVGLFYPPEKTSVPIEKWYIDE